MAVNRRIIRIIAIPLSLMSLWLLPVAIGSRLITVILLVALLVAAVWGGYTRHWRSFILLATYGVFIDLFGLLQLAPWATGLVIVALWLGGWWLIGHIDQAQSHVVHQSLVSFLVVEVLLILQLWPTNVLSKAVIVVTFALLLWSEMVREVPLAQRVRESVVPFLIIVGLMTATARWLTF